MSTESWSTRIRHDSDAAYREWRDELIGKLNLLSPLLAAETNITPGAGARPGANTEQGYAVYRLNDALNATAPIFLRFGFGTATQVTGPRLQLTTGTSTNGSGVLGGTALSTASNIHPSNGGSGTTVDTARQSYACAAEGFFGLFFKHTANNGSFFICRTCTALGVPDARGSLAHWGVGTSNNVNKRQAFRYESPAEAYLLQGTTSRAMLGFMPMLDNSSVIGPDIQAAVGWTKVPDTVPLFGVAGVLSGEINVGNTFSFTPVGSTARTFITLPNEAANFDAALLLNTAMLWE